MMLGDNVLSEPVVRRVEVFTGVGRRRRWSAEAKAQIVAESYATSVGEVADRYGLAKTQLFTWRREARGARGDACPSESIFAPVVLEPAPETAAAPRGEAKPKEARRTRPGRHRAGDRRRGGAGRARRRSQDSGGGDPGAEEVAVIGAAPDRSFRGRAGADGDQAGGLPQGSERVGGADQGRDEDRSVQRGSLRLPGQAGGQNQAPLLGRDRRGAHGQDARTGRLPLAQGSRMAPCA